MGREPGKPELGKPEPGREEPGTPELGREELGKRELGKPERELGRPERELGKPERVLGKRERVPGKPVLPGRYSPAVAMVCIAVRRDHIGRRVQTSIDASRRSLMSGKVALQMRRP